MTAPYFADVTGAPPPAQVLWQQASDGTRLRLAVWPAGEKGMVALFPGRTEVIEKYAALVAELGARGYGAVVIDWRGQGLSDRLEGKPLLGDVPDFAHYQRDVAVLRATLDAIAPEAPRFLLAHSMGGCIALRALVDGFAPRAVAFSAPMWGLPLHMATRRAVVAMTRVLGFAGRDLREVPGAGVEFRLWENLFDNNELTTDATRYAWMQAQVATHPELRLGAPSLRWLVAALAETAVLAQLPSPQIPAYCGVGTRETIVAPGPIEARMADWPEGALDQFEGGLHELLFERDAIRAPFLDRIIAHFDTQAG